MNKLQVIIQTNRWLRFQTIRTVCASTNRQRTANVTVRLSKHQPSERIGTLLINQRNLATAKNEQSDTSLQESPLDNATYERVCAETLDALCDSFEELLENANNLSGSDVAYSDGVLTVNLGKQHGTYVINRQTPNKQIWLSSPTSGPKRYDFVGPKTADTGRWIYKHNNESLHELLQRELKLILKDEQFDFYKLPYGS